jgi:hypothetical protein
MRCLTSRQIVFVYDTISLIKTTSEPIYRFLSDGAGVDKSFVTKALYQTALKFLNARSGEDFYFLLLQVKLPTILRVQQFILD